jgi:hypothetical protein
VFRRPFAPRLWLIVLLALLAAPLLAGRGAARPHPPAGELRHPTAEQLDEIDQVSDGPDDPALQEKSDKAREDEPGEEVEGEEEEEDLGNPEAIPASRLYVLVSTATFDVRDTASGCSRAHIYFPQRFVWKGCRVVTGVAQGGSSSPDGDYHARLKLDPPYRSMLTAGNINFYGGWLVLEQPCVKKSNKSYLGDACKNFRGKNPNLRPGARYRLVGNYVIDTQHHHWAEMHGISSVKRIG